MNSCTPFLCIWFFFKLYDQVYYSFRKKYFYYCVYYRTHVYTDASANATSASGFTIVGAVIANVSEPVFPKAIACFP